MLILSLALLQVPSAFANMPRAETFGMVPPPDRPDGNGGLFDFDETDVLEWLDGPEGRVRVTYSVSGTNVTLLDDDDANGLPDFPEEVAATAEDVLDAFEAAGFLPPLSEADLGLGELGGSAAFDFYLVDFGGNADGAFSPDACEGQPSRCSGYMTMENDFSGYGYSDLSSAIRTLTSHELFHAVQGAYNAYAPSWVSEGSAVWAERLFDPENEDFLWYASAYLEDAGRSLDEPPSGPVPTFAYATCLWWEYMEERLGNDTILEVMEAMADTTDEADVIPAMEAIIGGRGSNLLDEWLTFAAWNLATGDLAGVIESYPFAAELGGITYTKRGDWIDDDNRFYPLATYYYRLDHKGGPLWFANEDDGTGVHFSLYAVQGGELEGPVESLALAWEPGAPDMVELSPDLPESGYWLVGTQPENGASSVKIHFCIGDEDKASACGVEDTAAPVDTGTDESDEKGGCGCASSRSTMAWAGLMGLAALAWRRGRRGR